MWWKTSLGRQDATPWDPYGIHIAKLLEVTISQLHMEWAYWSSYQESFEAYVFFNTIEEGKLVPPNEIILFYTSCKLFILKYALPVFFYMLLEERSRTGRETGPSYYLPETVEPSTCPIPVPQIIIYYYYYCIAVQSAVYIFIGHNRADKFCF